MRLKVASFRTKLLGSTLAKAQALSSDRSRALLCNLDSVELLVEILFELGQFGSDRLLDVINTREHIGCFQAVSGDAQYRRFLRQNTILAIEFACGADGDTPGCFGKDAFRLGEQTDRIDYFGIADVFTPSAALLDGLDGIMPVRRIADSERTRDGRRFLGIDLRTAGFHRR